MSSGVKPAAVTAAAQQLKNAEPVSSDAVLMKKVLPSGFTSLWCGWVKADNPSFHVLTGQTMSAEPLPLMEMGAVRHFNPSAADIESKVEVQVSEGFEVVGLVDVLFVGTRWYVRPKSRSTDRPMQSAHIAVPDDLDFRA